MAQVPIEQRLAFGERRQMIGLDQATHGDRSQIGDDEVVACLERLDAGRIERERKARCASGEPEKDQLRHASQRAGLGQCERRIVNLAALAQHHHLAADDIDPRAGVVLQRCELSRLHSPLGRALDQAAV